MVKSLSLYSKNPPHATQKPLWRDHYEQLLGRQGCDSTWAACKVLAPLLSEAGGMRQRPWTPNYLLGVFRENKGIGPSPAFTMAVEKMYTPPRIRHDKPRVCVPVSADERQQINTLSAQAKRQALLVASKGSQ